jgi:protocatechuate 4,5-dioxygenase alpha chain
MGVTKDTDQRNDAAARQEIPGTFVFDAQRARRGYHLNMCCMALAKSENREAFKANEEEFLKRFKLTEDQRNAVMTRDYNRMLELGGNIYFLSKIAAVDGHSFQKIGGMMSGVSEADFRAMMAGGGRTPGQEPEQS